jgi:hypothetical protein
VFLLLLGYVHHRNGRIRLDTKTSEQPVLVRNGRTTGASTTGMRLSSTVVGDLRAK